MQETLCKLYFYESRIIFSLITVERRQNLNRVYKNISPQKCRHLIAQKLKQSKANKKGHKQSDVLSL